MIENILKGVEVRLNTDYLKNREELDKEVKKVVYTGSMILVTSIFHYTFAMMLLLAYGYALLADNLTCCAR